MNKQYVQGGEDVGRVAEKVLENANKEVNNLGEKLIEIADNQRYINNEIIENLKQGDYGFLAITLDKMSSEDKVLVISALNRIKKACHSLSVEANTYYSQLLAVIGFEPLLAFSPDKLSNLIEKDAECALFLLVEYKAFFKEQSVIQTADDFVDHITVSPKKRRELEAIVQASVHEIGLSGILSKYEMKALKEEIKRLKEKLEEEKKQREVYEKKVEEDDKRRKREEDKERERKEKLQHERRTLTEMRKDAEKAVAVAVTAAAGIGAVPIPFADAPILIGNQVTLMASIADIFKIDIKKDGLTILAWAALGISGATFLGKTILINLLKCIPGIGTVAGGVFSAATAGIMTYGMGMAFIEVCKAVKVGKLQESDITSTKGKTMFKEYFTAYSKEKSKEVS